MSLQAKSSDGCDPSDACESSHVHNQPAVAQAHDQSAGQTDGTVPANCLDATLLAAALGFQLKAGCITHSSTSAPGETCLLCLELSSHVDWHAALAKLVLCLTLPLHAQTALQHAHRILMKS